MLPFEKHYKNPCWHADSGEFLYLTHFMLIGMPKCGTTDIFYSIVQHPDVEYPVNKSDKLLKKTHFFDALHYDLDYGGNEDREPTSHVMRFEHYVQAFRRAASVISYNLSRRSDVRQLQVIYKGFVYNWIYIPQIKNRSFPIVAIPHTIQHILPRVKLIITLRDSVERPFESKGNETRLIIQNKWENKSPQFRYTPMNESSYDVLHDFYRPFNVKLNQLLKNEFNYTWEKEQYNMYRNRLNGFAKS